MSFSFALISAFFLLSLGGAMGCLFCMLCGRIFHKPVLKSRLTIFCILLSVSIAVLAFSLLLTPELYASRSALFGTVSKNAGFLGGLLVCGILCSSFWRSVLPFAVSCYIAVSVFTGIKLYGTFGANEEALSVVAQSDAIKVNGTGYPVDDVRGKAIVLKRYTVPSVLLVPLPRVWYVVCGVAEKTDGGKILSSSELVHFSGRADEPVSFSGEGKDFFLGGAVQRYREWLLASVGYQLVPVEDSEIYPALYTIRIKASGENLIATLSRNL